MNYLYLVSHPEELLSYCDFSERCREQVEEFLNHLKDRYAVTELPNAVILTGKDIATKQISGIPLPAYTNEFRTVFCPDIAVWREVYLQQLQCANDLQIRRYYETALTENHILQILGHEFVHHSDLFIDEAWENARWFEEGMCEYISRKYFLTDAEFEEETRINERLVRRYEERLGEQSLKEFNQNTYIETLEDIFYLYWKSFLTVYTAIRQLGTVEAVFREYHSWFMEASDMSLTDWFGI